MDGRTITTEATFDSCCYRDKDFGVTHLELFDIDTGIVGEAFRVCDLDVGFLQFISQIIPHLGEKQRRREVQVNR